MEEARRRARRRRWEIASGGLVLAIIIAIAFAAKAGNDNKTATPPTSTTVAASTTAATTTTTGPTTTTKPLPSAAGKPCVAVTGTLPPGAPAVPVKTGTPPTALVKEALKVGTGAVVKAHANISVNYIGVACSTGKVFDSSYKSGVPAQFSLDGVIPGWTNGIPGMKVGGERLLGIPPAQAYGAAGSPPLIAPNETLWFVVTVTSIQ